jgi:sulfite reductase beta subunit-like hemoprotein
MPQYRVEDHLGWHAGIDGRLFVGIFVPSGRLRDGESGNLRTGLREVVKRYFPSLHVTPKQNIVLGSIAPADRPAIEALLAEHGLQTELPRLPRLAMACVALPTCGLALAESERYLPTLLDELVAAGVGDADVEIRMTGCPNSCVRTPTAEIGISGRGPRKYNLYLGGSQLGTRLAYKFKEMVAEEDLSPIIVRLINAWRAETQGGASFGDWACSRGADALGQLFESAG